MSWNADYTMDTKKHNVRLQWFNVDPRQHKCVFGYVNSIVEQFYLQKSWPITLSQLILMFAFIHYEKLVLKYHWRSPFLCLNKRCDELAVISVQLRRNYFTVRGKNLLSLDIKKIVVWNVHVVIPSKRDTSIIIGIINQKLSRFEKMLAYDKIPSINRNSIWPTNYYYCVNTRGYKYRCEAGKTEIETLNVDYFSCSDEWKGMLDLRVVMDSTKQKTKLRFFINNQHCKHANFNDIKWYNLTNRKENVYTLAISFNAYNKIKIKLNDYYESIYSN